MVWYNSRQNTVSNRYLKTRHVICNICSKISIIVELSCTSLFTKTELVLPKDNPEIVYSPLVFCEALPWGLLLSINSRILLRVVKKCVQARSMTYLAVLHYFQKEYTLSLFLKFRIRKAKFWFEDSNFTRSDRRNR